jgi:hypothetical protein
MENSLRQFLGAIGCPLTELSHVRLFPASEKFLFDRPIFTRRRLQQHSATISGEYFGSLFSDSAKSVTILDLSMPNFRAIVAKDQFSETAESLT